MSTTKITVTNKTNKKPVNVILFRKNEMKSSSAIVWQVIKKLASGKSQTVDYDNYPLLSIKSPSGDAFPVKNIVDGGRFEIREKSGVALLTQIYENALSSSGKTQIFNNLKKGSTSASILISKSPIMTQKIIPPLQGAAFLFDMNIYIFVDTTKKLKQGDSISFEQIRSAQFYPMIDTVSVAIEV